MRRKRDRAAAACAVAIVLGASTASMAQQLPAGAAYSNGMLTVLGANGFAASAHSRTGVPGFASLGRLPDGDYTYQLTAATSAVLRNAAAATDGRRGTRVAMRKGAAASGSFRVVGGAILLPRAGASDRDDRD